MTALPIANTVAIKAADSPSIDAFARLRVSNPETIFDSKLIFDAAPLAWDDQEESGGGSTSTHSTDTASVVMAVASTTAAVRTRQTFMRFNYQPGKSQLIFMTFVLHRSGTDPGIIRTIGYGDDNNGLFLRCNEGTYQFIRRTYSSGAAVDNVVNQASWNIDPMDGSGPSGITLDFSKTQILIIDFEWLGVGRARLGFVVDGIPVYAHEFLNANNLDVVYMSTPNLPLRFQIENDGTGAAATMEHICCSVISEGGLQKVGVLRHTDSEAVAGLQTGNAYAILGGKLKPGFEGASVDVESISILLTSNDTAHWELVAGGSVTGGFAYSSVPFSAVMVAVGSAANQHAGGVEADGGYLSQVQGVQFNVPNALRLGAAIDGTAQEWFLVVKPISNNVTLHASVTWRELL